MIFKTLFICLSCCNDANIFADIFQAGLAANFISRVVVFFFQLSKERDNGVFN